MISKAVFRFMVRRQNPNGFPRNKNNSELTMRGAVAKFIKIHEK
ncbi:MAG TPA: hypothetical protein PLH27_07870 [bacterium]|nr:hypothetical protein [bacterium]